MEGNTDALLELLTPPALWQRFADLCTERPDIRVLSYVLGSRRKALEWIHSVGVCTDAELLRHAPPLAPQELRQIVAAPEPEKFLWTGLIDLLSFLELYEQYRRGPIHTPAAILDFGCGCGRLLRLLAGHADVWRVTGTDVNPALVDWCRSNLRAVETDLNGLVPPLRLTDQSFDLVYALSVFTHLPEAATTLWLDELSRILRPGGILIVTTSGTSVLETIRNSTLHQTMFGINRTEVDAILKDFAETGLVFKRYDPHVIQLARAGQDYGNLFIHRQYVLDRWHDQRFEVCEHLPGGLRGWQDIVVLRRRL